MWNIKIIVKLNLWNTVQSNCLMYAQHFKLSAEREGKLYTGSRSTFEFPSRVNLSGPSLYCIARTLSKHSMGLAGATRLTPSDFSLNLLVLKGQLEVREALENQIYLVTHEIQNIFILLNNLSIKEVMIENIDV